MHSETEQAPLPRFQASISKTEVKQKPHVDLLAALRAEHQAMLDGELETISFARALRRSLDQNNKKGE